MITSATTGGLPGGVAGDRGWRAGSTWPHPANPIPVSTVSRHRNATMLDAFFPARWRRVPQPLRRDESLRTARAPGSRLPIEQAVSLDIADQTGRQARWLFSF